jgi:hypothetical protein
MHIFDCKGGYEHITRVRDRGSNGTGSIKSDLGNQLTVNLDGFPGTKK